MERSQFSVIKMDCPGASLPCWISALVVALSCGIALLSLNSRRHQPIHRQKSGRAHKGTCQTTDKTSSNSAM